MDGEVDLKFGGRCLELGRKPVNGNGLEALRGAGRVRLGSDFGGQQLKLGIGVDGGEQGGRLVVFIGMQMQECPGANEGGIAAYAFKRAVKQSGRRVGLPGEAQRCGGVMGKRRKGFGGGFLGVDMAAPEGFQPFGAAAHGSEDFRAGRLAKHDGDVGEYGLQDGFRRELVEDLVIGICRVCFGSEGMPDGIVPRAEEGDGGAKNVRRPGATRRQKGKRISDGRI